MRSCAWCFHVDPDEDFPLKYDDGPNYRRRKSICKQCDNRRNQERKERTGRAAESRYRNKRRQHDRCSTCYNRRHHKKGPCREHGGMY